MFTCKFQCCWSFCTIFILISVLAASAQFKNFYDVRRLSACGVITSAFKLIMIFFIKIKISHAEIPSINTLFLTCEYIKMRHLGVSMNFLNTPRTNVFTCKLKICSSYVWKSHTICLMLKRQPLRIHVQGSVSKDSHTHMVLEFIRTYIMVAILSRT